MMGWNEYGTAGTVNTTSCLIHGNKGSVWPHTCYHISQCSFIALLCEPGRAQITVKLPGGQTQHPKE